jgi:hypothetical protein
VWSIMIHHSPSISPASRQHMSGQNQYARVMSGKKLAAANRSRSCVCCASTVPVCSCSSGTSHSLKHTIKRLPPHCPTTKTTPDISLETLAIDLQVLRGLFIQRVARVWLEEQELQPDHHRVQVEHRLPVLAQDVQAHVAFKVDVRMVDLLRALDFGRVVWEVLVDCEAKYEASAFVHALVGVDGQGKIEDIVGVGEVRFHRRAERELFEV